MPPYYIIPAVLAYPESSGEERTRLARKIAAAIGDPVALRAILGIVPEEFLSFYPDMKMPELSTDDTIDTFIDKFGDKTKHQPKEVDEILPPVAASPYDLSMLEALPEAESEQIPDIDPEADPANQTSSMLDAFLAANPPKRPALSQSLAKVMIKNGNYQKALEIITELSLNNPKKSIYFADQMRFLKKLIAIQQKTH